MRKLEITLDLSPSGIRAAQRQIQAVSDWIESKTRQLLERLAEIGFQEARVMFNYAEAFYNNGKGGINADLTVEPIENGYAIRASGEDVCFIEFGAGVTYDTGYPGERPEGVVGIGEYGRGQGANPNGWNYPAVDGWKHTKGNPPAAGMFAATQTIRQQVYNIAREVFA